MSALAAPQALPCAVFLVATMSAAGIAHALWLRSELSLRLSGPVDLHLELRGRRIFGPNKMWRGFAMMPLAAAMAFWTVGSLRPGLPAWLASGMWDLSGAQYAALGLACGFAFMLAELPNSFVKRQLDVAPVGLACGFAFMLAELPNSFLKRQLDVAPGMAARGRGLAAVFFVFDRVDSVLGVLIVLTAMLPVAPGTWAWVLLLGPGTHWLFSLWLYYLDVKARPL